MILLVLVGFVDGQGSGGGVGGIDPAGHPVVGSPLAASRVELLKDLPEVVALFGFGGVEGECLCSHL